MFPSHALLALMMAAADSAAAPPDTTETPSPRVVRRLEEVVVRASPLHDVLSSETVHIVSREALRTLPIDRLVEALGLKAGVVVQGEELHVRGGRAGETQLLVRGVPLNDALRSRPMELPLAALESAELVSGGLDPEYGGALAGVVQVRTADPTPRWSGEATWGSDGWLGSAFFDPTHWGRVSGRVGGPVLGKLGAVVAGEVLTDDTYLPALRTRSDARSWRADNHLLGFAKLAPVGSDGRISLELFGSRRVTLPYNPMWSLDGYTTPCGDPFCTEPAFSDAPLPGYSRFRAADHATMTDEHRYAAVLSGWRPLASGRLRGAASWTTTRRLTSVGGRDDERYLGVPETPIFGVPGSPGSDPFYTYGGFEPYFERATAETYQARADYDRTLPPGDRFGFGIGTTYDHVTMREIDIAHRRSGIDSLRSYVAYAPGGFAYAQGRWIYQGLVLNGGFRTELFTAGPQAEDQVLGSPARLHWMVTPRLGIAFPISTRDVMSFSYVRIEQAPPRDFLYENRRFNTAREPLGNPGLVPSTVISYQVAVKHLFEGGSALQVGFFYRDLFGQIGARSFQVRPGDFRKRYSNEDAGSAQGFELGWILPGSERGRVEVQYTLMHAAGNQSLEEGRPFGNAVTPGTPPIAEVPLDWDRRHSIAVLGSWTRPAGAAAPIHGPIDVVLRGLRGSWTLSWASLVGSPLPWTPSVRNSPLTDPKIVNSARFDWQENTSAALRWAPLPLRDRVSVGIDVRNLFDFRSERAATLEGYPHPTINTVYDDDGAFRGETDLPGGAYWDGPVRDAGAPTAWTRIHDPRLFGAPRLVRFSVNARW